MIIELEPELVHRLSKLDAASHHVVEAIDAELAAAVRRTAMLRKLFYTAVLGVALYGTATGAIVAFGLPWWVAAGGIFALELGGVVFLANAEVRRRLGEPATVSRLLGALVAAAAATFNLLTHHDGLLGGFFALMSVLGFVTWWLDTENKRRDRLRAHGQLAAPGPVYQLWAHWLRHPILTRRARAIADAYPQLGLYGSLYAAQLTIRRERRNAALAAALRRRIRQAVGRRMATIAVRTFDMDRVAGRLLDTADYDGLTAVLAAELSAQRLTRSVAADGRVEGNLGRSHKSAAVAGEPAPATEPGSIVRPAATLVLPPASQAGSRQEHESGSDRRPVVRVLGPPAVLDLAREPARGLRRKSGELLVFLALHRDGATTTDIVTALWPDIPISRAVQRLSTCLANVRSIIRALRDTAPASAAERVEPVLNLDGRYRLNQCVVDVDWWNAAPPDAKGQPLAVDGADINQLAQFHSYQWLDMHLVRAAQRATGR